MVKILCFHCRGHGFNSLAEELNSHMSYSAAKKKKKNHNLLWCLSLPSVKWDSFMLQVPLKQGCLEIPPFPRSHRSLTYPQVPSGPSQWPKSKKTGTGAWR